MAVIILKYENRTVGAEPTMVCPQGIEVSLFIAPGYSAEEKDPRKKIRKTTKEICRFSHWQVFIENDYDVKVKRYPMALSLVKLHKQPKGLGERPVLGR